MNHPSAPTAPDVQGALVRGDHALREIDVQSTTSRWADSIGALFTLAALISLVGTIFGFRESLMYGLVLAASTLSLTTSAILLFALAQHLEQQARSIVWQERSVAYQREVLLLLRQAMPERTPPAGDQTLTADASPVARADTSGRRFR